jgi:hypothetical protein
VFNVAPTQYIRSYGDFPALLAEEDLRTVPFCELLQAHTGTLLEPPIASMVMLLRPFISNHLSPLWVRIPKWTLNSFIMCKKVNVEKQNTDEKKFTLS